MEEEVLVQVHAIGAGAKSIATETKVKTVLWGSLAGYAIYKCAKNLKLNIEMSTIFDMAAYVLKETGE